MNLLSALLLATATAAPSPAPQPSTPPDPCGGDTTALLATLNRPTIGYSPCAVKPRQTVVEAGYANLTGSGGTLATFPQGNIRFGIAPNVELQTLGPAYSWQSHAGIYSAGTLDASIGGKVEWWHNASSAFGTDVLFGFPTGSAAFTIGFPTETVNFNYGTALSPKFGFGTTLGVETGRFTTLLPSIVFSNQFEDRAQFYAEAFGVTKTTAAGGSLFGVNGGVQYLIVPSVEIDAELGSTVTNLAHAHYVGVGFGLRL